MYRCVCVCVQEVDVHICKMVWNAQMCYSSGTNVCEGDVRGLLVMLGCCSDGRGQETSGCWKSCAGAQCGGRSRKLLVMPCFM